MTVALYGALLALGVLLLAVTAVRVLVGGLDTGSAPQPGARGTDARQLLDERYAAGGLSTEEYQHRLRILEEEGA